MEETSELRIERILKKLSQVQHKKLSCFGSDNHNFQLNAPIDESTLLRFESEHGVTLPSDYRSFLKLAGNGGAGPYYGIYKLDQWKDFIDWTSDDSPENILALPSPLYPNMPRDADWEAQVGSCISPYQGMVSIGSQGCTYAMGLIVTGEYAGRVVYLDADGQAPYVVREPDFLSWYERWLDELLGGYDMFWFGYGIGGDEANLAASLDSTATSNADRAQIVYAMRRLPRLSTEARKRICALLDDEAPEVRAAACHVIEKFAITESKELLASLLHDESSEVQKAAIGAYIKVRGDEANHDVTQLLESDDEDVAERAFFELKGNGNLPRETLLRLVESSPHGGIRYCAASSLKWNPENEALLIDLLTDQHSKVRFYATLGLRQIASQASLDAVIYLLSHESDAPTIDSALRMLGEVPGDRNAEVLLEWTRAGDDFHLLSAVDSLCKLGDVRVEPVAKLLLNETRPPVRVDASGFPGMSNVKSMQELVRESLRASPNRNLRRLVSPFCWPRWMTLWQGR